MKKTLFIKNAIVLTVTSLILRFVGIVFKVWLASAIGAEGIGLYQLVFSVYVLVSTFASSGICTAVTRLVADELALGTKKGTVKILNRSIQITLIIAILSAIVVFFGAKPISLLFLKDARAIPALKILTFSLPFMGISSCLRGYFIARRHATPSAATQLLEQAVRIGLLMLLIGKFANKGLTFCCAAVLGADTVAETVSCACLYIVYLKDKEKLSCLSGRERPPFPIVKRLMQIAMPITSGRYLNTTLRTAENILVPINLAKYRFSSENSLAQFGMIKGMALPVLFFPSTLLNSLTTLLIPEMSESLAKKRYGIIKYTTETVLRITSLISFIFAALFFMAGKEIGILVYKSADVGFLLCALSPIVPMMYLDSVADGILKGLDQQLYTFKTAAFDSSIRIVLILIALPIGGMKAFILIMYFSNLLTCILHLIKLCKISGARLSALKGIIVPLLSAILVSATVQKLLLGVKATNNLVYIILFCLISIFVYAILLFLTGCVTKDDIEMLFFK